MSDLGNKQIFAENLRYYVGRSGKSQKELSEIVGVATSTFNNWMKAQKYPRIDKIEILADFFGILKSDLIEKKTIKNSPVEMAERHVEMIMDEDLNEIFDYLKMMDAGKRKIAKGIIKSLAETETEA